MPHLDGLGPHTLQPCRGLRSDRTKYWEDTSMRSCEAHVVGRSPELPARLWSRSRGSPPSSHPPSQNKALCSGLGFKSVLLTSPSPMAMTRQGLTLLIPSSGG